jgi:hypothetical protein
VNPTQINQLELNLVINEKSQTFKGMSNKKHATTIKKTQQKPTKEKKRSCINPHRSTNAVVPRQRMYHDPPPITCSKFVLSYDLLYLMNYNINMFVCLYSRHWILAMVCPKISWIFILDPLDVEKTKYKEFIECIQW